MVNLLFCLLGMVICLVNAKQHPFKALMLSKFKQLRDFAESYLHEHDLPYAPTPDYPYWNFMPQYVTSLMPGTTATQWKSPCKYLHLIMDGF